VGFIRNTDDERQFIYCISNITDRDKTIPVTRINLQGDMAFIDLISGSRFDQKQENMTLKPYQTVWLSNIDLRT
jgi:sucrose phosphorylase